MPRKNDATELFKFLTDLSVYRLQTGGVGDTTLATSLAVGAPTASVAVTTSFTNGDPVFLIGANGFELNQISGTVALAMPLQYKAAIAQLVGTRFVEAQAIDVGEIDDAGPVLTPSQQLIAIFSAVSRGAIQYMYGPGEMQLDFGIHGFNILNLQTALGIVESEAGAGTPTDPYIGTLLGTQMGTQGVQCIRLTGVRHDGLGVMVDCNNAKIVASGAMNLNGKDKSPIPCSARFTSCVVRIGV